MVPNILTRQPRAPHQHTRPPLEARRRRRAGAPRLLHRPIFGDVFGRGRFALATRPCIARGLHAVEYLVIEPRRGQVLASAADKGEVLAQARALILDAERQASLWPEHELRAQPTQRPRMPSRRRREIFNRSRGRCHYCATPLQLAGPWHADHMQPKALDGADDLLNLVASCAACNLAKGPLTSLEFIYAEEPQQGL